MKRKPRSKPHTVVKVGNVTVKLYKRTRATTTGKFREVFEVADYTTGLRRLRGFTDLAEAKREADKIARQLSSGDATAATMRNSEAASFGRAGEILRPTGASLELAASVYAKCFEILGEDKMIEAAHFLKRHGADQVTRCKVAVVVDELVTSKTALGKSDAYVNDLRQRLARFATAFAVDISTITTADAQRWLDGLKLSAQSAKNFRTVLHTLFAFAESRGYIFKGGNPVASTENISVKGGDIEIFTPEEITKLLKSASKEFLPFVALGGFAGLRTAEILRIEWKNIDVAGGFIHIGSDKAKTRSRRLVPILPNLAKWLADYSKETGLVWKRTANDLHDARGESVKASGVPWKDNGLRHSFISYRLADVQNAAQVALEAGNSPNVVFKHYRELVKPADATAWFAIVPEAKLYRIDR
ncbi:MAG: tyrosine-type recombinase/integrase [Akkermansiaceae bacterium]|nr:tyrosine-type recombinase/integrase [Verrucomicrobiales bacterium]